MVPALPTWSLFVLYALISCAACARGPAMPCPAAATTAGPQPVPAELSTLAWLDAASIPQAKDPLTLYDVRWLILTGDSGAFADVPDTLHSFTLGRWECALSAEKTSDKLTDGKASVDRKRRLVCTHPTGVIAQSELQCSWQTPSSIRAGSPAQARREMKLILSDAPSVSVSCEPQSTDRLPIYQGEHERTAEACVLNGQVKPCATAAP